MKWALADLAPLTFNAVRFLAAGLLVVVVTRMRGRRWTFERAHWPWLIALGLLGNTVYQVLFIYGADATTADNAALMLATMPVWVSLLGSLAGTEEVRPRGWMGIGLSFLGIACIILGSDRAAHFEFGGATLQGDLLMLVATLCWSAYTMLMRLAVRRYDSLAVTSFCTVVGAVPLVLLGLPDLFGAGGQAPPAAFLAAALSGTLAIGLAYFFWNYAISHLGSAHTSFYSNLTPIVALVTAWLWLGETLTVAQGMGAALAISGVVLARRHSRPVG